MQVRPVEPGDEHAICDIYNHYVAHTTVTFEEVPLTPAQMRERIDTYTQTYPWLVCAQDDQIVGYAYASKWHQRAAYRHTAETTVYVGHAWAGRGHGKALYAALIDALRSSGCHVLLGCIALPNVESVGLHERFGFTKVGHMSEVGRKFDRWLDVGYWQKTIERP